MNTADLITAFFNNEMSPDQERQFLLSVASSDSLRLGLKSHAMLDKILYEQSSQSRVPVEVRMNIMKEAAVVAAAAGSAFAADEASANAGDGTVSLPEKSTSVDPRNVPASRRFFRWSSATLLLMIGIGSFFAGFYTGTETTDDPVVSAAQRNGGLISPSTLPNTVTHVPADPDNAQEQANNGADRIGVARRMEDDRAEHTAVARNTGRTSVDGGSLRIPNSGRSGATAPSSDAGDDGTGSIGMPSVSVGPLQQFTVPSDSTRK